MHAEPINPLDLTLKELTWLAARLIKPAEGKQVSWCVADADSDKVIDLDDMIEESDGNVHDIRTGAPIEFDETDAQEEDVRFTVELMEMMLERARNGEFQDVAMIVGKRSEEAMPRYVATAITTGVIDNANVFLGGMRQLEFQIMNDIHFGGEEEEE